MGPLSDNYPKPMHPVSGKPILGHVLEGAIEAGAEELVVVTGYEGSKIRERFGDAFQQVPVEYVTQSTPDGTASAVASASDVIDGAFAVLNGDCLYEHSDLGRLFEDGPGIGVAAVDNPREYGVVSVAEGRIEEIVEKPTDPPTSLANTGAYVFPADALDKFDVEQSARGEYELTDVVRRVTDSHELRAVRFDRWMDIGYPWDLLEANEELLENQETSLDGDVAPDATIDGEVVVEPGATIKSGVVIEGPARIRSGSVVGPNAYLRGATLVDRDVKIGHAVEIKNSIIMAGSAVPHLSYVGDSVIGRNVNLGAGTIIANVRHDRAPINLTVKGNRMSTGREKFGAVVGDDVRTGINTSINPGVTLSTGATSAPGESVSRDR